MLDAHHWDGETLLCHALCPLGSLPLADGLGVVEDFLHTHRGEVVTIIFESYVTSAEMTDAFAASGLDRLVHVQDPSAPWPTLREMIDADTRAVIFTDAPDAGPDWYMDVWAHASENPFSARTVDEFSCDPNRGDPSNPLFIFNHFLTDTFAVPDEAATVNANPFLLDRATECAATRGLPNFVTVDFYDVGDLFDTVAALNAGDEG
jgi:hypothetical protein